MNDPASTRLHLGQLVLGVLMVVLASAVLLQETGVLQLRAAVLAPVLLMTAGLVLLLGAARLRDRP